MAMKELKPNQRATKKSKSDWLQKVRENTGKSVSGQSDFLIEDEILFKALGPVWTLVLKEAILKQAVNILAITSKSARKTAIVKFIQHYLLARHKWLQAKDLRRTKDVSSTELIKAHLSAISFWANEYGLPWIQETITQSATAMFFVRDPKRKDNQKIEFSSFDAMKAVGGFTSPYVLHWEELVDPDSKGQAPDRDTFLYTYNLVNDKNKENFIAQGHGEYLFPTHWFTMNRWDTDHPLIEFAEEHCPWEPVKQWMLEDPVENSAFMHFVDEANHPWEALNKTLIVYMNKLSNHILIQNEEWKERQLKLIATGIPEHLGTVLGDVFEGTKQSLNAYHYTRRDKVAREIFLKDYAPYVNKIYISIDLDFSRQIRIRPKYAASKPFVGGAQKRLIREKPYSLKCDGVSKDGAKTEFYLKQTNALLERILKQIREEMPHIRRIHLLFDDKKAQWVGRFNYSDMANPMWFANKVDFDQKWPIKDRPKTFDEAQDTGFLIDIEHPSNEILHKYLKKVIIDETTHSKTKMKIKKRLEKDRDEMVDDMNADEYPIYLERANMALNNRATRILGGNIWTETDD